MKHFSFSMASGFASALALLPLSTLAAFPDVTQNHPNYAAIEYVQKAGIVSGYSDGTYHPDQNINRAEFAKILMAAKYSQNEISDCQNHIQSLFTDTPSDAWFTPYICTAFQNGIVNGYPNGSFKPTNDISFAEAAKMIQGTFDVAWVSENNSCTAQYTKWFTTSGSLDDAANPFWWQKYVCAIQAAHGLPSSYQKPEQLVTRGEMAEMVYRLQADSNKPASVGNKNQTYTDPAGFSFTYNPEQVRVPSFETIYCTDPKDLSACPRPQYRSTLITANKTYNGGDYIASIFNTEVAFYHSYDVSNNFPPESRTLFTADNVDAYFDQYVQGFKNDPTFLDGRGPYITKIVETTLHGQRAAMLYAEDHLSTVIFNTQPYPNSISFIGVIDMDGALTSETDAFMQSLMDSLQENVQEVYARKL
jgi:S-layer homology domain